MRRHAASVLILLSLALARIVVGQPARMGGPFDLATSLDGLSISDASVDGTGTAALVWIDAAGNPNGGLLGFAGAALGARFALDNPAGTRVADVDVAGLPGGGFLGTWETVLGSTSRVLAQCVDGEGSPLGLATRLDEATRPHPGRPALAASAGGRVLAVWEQDTVDASLLEGRFLDAGCNPTSGVFAITTRHRGLPSQPTVTAGAEERFLVAWRSEMPSGAGIEAVLLDGDGTPLGPVNAFAGEGAVSAPVVAADPRGGFLVAWMEEAADRFAVRARRLDHPHLTPGEPLTLAAAPLSDGGILSLAYQGDGTLLVAWRIGTSVMARSYAPNGLPHEDAFRVSIPAEAARSPHVLAGPGSRYVIAWMSTRGTGASLETAARGQILSLCGNAVLDPGETCDDGNGRDDDCCSSTCAPVEVDGECWLLSRRSVLRAIGRRTVDGRTEVCRARCQIGDHDLLVLGDDGAYRIPGGLVTCNDGTLVTFPDERGDVVERKRRFEAVPVNLVELDAAFFACSATRLATSEARFRRAADGRTLGGRQRVTLRGVGAMPVHTRIRTTVVGARSDTGPFPEPPRRRRGLFECVFPLQLECRPR